MKEWPKFKAGDHVWSALRNCWVELEGDQFTFVNDGRWNYTQEGQLLGSENPIRMLFLNEVKPEDWPQPEPPRPNLEVDAPVMVREPDNSRWFKRHFAAWHDTGSIICWAFGGTSFTASETVAFQHWRLPTEEELKH